LRTPLTPVLAAAGLLERDMRLPADVRQDLAMIRRNINIQARLIDDLLDLTRIERGRFELDRQVIPVPALLRDAMSIVAPDLDAREQSLELRCDLPNNCSVSGDAARLQQVLWNLLKNASKFSPVRSRIVLSATHVPGQQRVVVAVQDAGPGISTADRERIFLPFQQAEQMENSSNQVGLGLGLAIAKAIVERHDGRIYAAAPEEGVGARLVLELPTLPVSQTNAALPEGARPSGAGGRTLRILLVEDHQDTGRVIARLLKNAGHSVVHASDAASALGAFADQPFDLVVSDLGLPDESGLVLMQKLRERQPDLPGICMSGYGMEHDLQACMAVGFSEHLTKPVDMPRLHAAINRVAAGKQLQHESVPPAA
jgi:CheY-like chemotaxis protein